MNLPSGYDWALCRNDKCPRKDTCVRYKLHLRAVRENYDGLVSMLIVKDPETCTSYWKLK